MGRSNNPKNEAIMSRLKCEVRKLSVNIRISGAGGRAVTIYNRTTHYRPA